MNLEELQTVNRDTLHSLAKRGYPVDDLTLLRIRVNALTAIVLAPYPEEAAAEFERVYEGIVSEVLAAYEQELDGTDETDSD